VVLLGVHVPYAALWAGGAFVVMAALVFLFCFGVETGIGALDTKTHGLIDLLIDTEAELTKVSWPDSDELSVSTTAVLVSVVLLGTFLLCVDWLVALLMRTTGVLPR
jgi:preprotein translocase SecE subunit